MRKTFKVLFVTMLILAILCVSAAAASDEPATWAKENVEAMISAGLIGVGMQNSYSVDITRGEFSDVIVRIYEKAVKTNKSAEEIPNKFTDIETSLYRDSIKKAVAYGFVGGISNSKFDPESNITREQCATMIYRMMKSLGADLSVGKIQRTTFDDYAEQSPGVADSIEYCVKAGLMRGTTEYNFTPMGKLTREQAYAIFYRVGRSCGFFRENTVISDYGELGSLKLNTMCEEKGKLYYMQYDYRWVDEAKTIVEPFYEIWCADSATGKVELYHKFPEHPAKDTRYGMRLVAIDSENFYYVSGGILALNRKSFESRMFPGTEGASVVKSYGDTLYFSRENQLFQFSLGTGEVKKILSFAYDIDSEQMHIIDNTIYVITRQERESRLGLYRADTDGSSVSFLGNERFENMYFFKDGILVLCTDNTDNGFPSIKQKIYEFGYGSQQMNYIRADENPLSYQVFDGVLYSAVPYHYKVLKSKTGQILGSFSGDDDMKIRCGDYYYDYNSVTFYARNLRTGRAIARYHQDDRDLIDYYYKMAEKVKELVRPTMSDSEKAKVITDWICKVAEYDYAYESGTADPPSPESGYELGLFYDGQLVCQGYADVTARMFQLAGLDCYYATGDNHAWVNVKIDGKYYVVDTTWDDSREANKRSYAYFLIAPENYQNKYSPRIPIDPDSSLIIFAEENYPLTGIRRDKTYKIP